MNLGIELYFKYLMVQLFPEVTISFDVSYNLGIHLNVTFIYERNFS